MGKKYIIELLDECKSKFKGIMVFGLTQEKQISVEMIPEESMTPYTEPDLEQVRKEAFKNGYDAACKDIDIKSKTNAAYWKGLEDAWECVRNLGNMTHETIKEIFGCGFFYVLDDLTASEAIEKIRQYEQKKEWELGIREYFKKGEEVIDDDGTKAVILVVSEDNYCQVYTENGCIQNWHIHTYKFHKTGRHFPEIAEVLRKMKGEN